MFEPSAEYIAECSGQNSPEFSSVQEFFSNQHPIGRRGNKRTNGKAANMFLLTPLVGGGGGGEVHHHGEAGRPQGQDQAEEVRTAIQGIVYDSYVQLIRR